VRTGRARRHGCPGSGRLRWSCEQVQAVGTIRGGPVPGPADIIVGLAAVAQLDRVLGYEPRGRGFESCQPHQQIKDLRQKWRESFFFCGFCAAFSRAVPLLSRRAGVTQQGLVPAVSARFSARVLPPRMVSKSRWLCIPLHCPGRWCRQSRSRRSPACRILERGRF
jgi:hypothetical protein